jgi:hypothetical protein
MRYRTRTPPAIFIDSESTRDDVIVRAQTVIRHLRFKRSSVAHPLCKGEGQRMLNEIAFLRAAAFARNRRENDGRLFYVTIRNGEQWALINGPFATRIAALRALPDAKRVALDRFPIETSFAAFGTAGLDASVAIPGLLNAYLPAIESAHAAGIVA